jgi:hypothetical protein
MTDTLTAGPSAPQAPAPEPDAGSFPRRVVDTFFSPVALFRRFGARPPWVDVTVLSVIITVLFFLLIPGEVLVNTAEEAMRQSGQPAPAGMDPESMASIQRYTLLAVGVIAPWMGLVIQAGVMVLIFSVMLGGQATFRQYVGVVAHAGLVSAVGGLISLPLMVRKGVMDQGITLAALAGGADPDSFIYQFLNAFNVFMVWQIVLLALGAAALNRRIGAGTAVVVLLGLYACIAAAIAAII